MFCVFEFFCIKKKCFLLLGVLPDLNIKMSVHAKFQSGVIVQLFVIFFLIEMEMKLYIWEESTQSPCNSNN